jgi:hypothetical protein
MENNNIADKISNMFSNAISMKHGGTPPLIHTPVCEIWKLDGHENCIGCESELKCDKFCSLILIDVSCRTNTLAMIGIKPDGFSVMEYMVDIVRAMDKDALEAAKPFGLKRINKPS